MRPSLVATSIVALVSAAVLAATPPAGGVAGFGDVQAGKFFTEAVQWMVDNEITTGTSPTCFSPDDPVTRGQAAAFLWRIEGSPEPASAHPFSDVVAEYQQKPVSWMSENQITTGTTPTTYSPDDTLTRGQMAALIHRTAGEPAAAPTTFPDVFKDWQLVPVGWMEAEGITTGTTPTTFSPEDPVTRGQFATFAWRWKGEPAVVIDEDSPACGPPALGTMADPLAIGDVKRVGDWDVAIVGFVGDATAAVLAEDPFNAPPGAGNVYVLIRVRATYRGVGAGNAYLELTTGLVGSNLLAYDDLTCVALAPDDMVKVPDALPGGTAEGNFCVILPSGQVPSAVLFVEPTFSAADEKVWWAQS
jgi:hypothetical protein